MEEKLGVPQEEAIPVWQKAFAKYNQTLKGLRETGFEFDVAEYWDYIRAGAEDFLSPDPQASTCKLSLPFEGLHLFSCLAAGLTFTQI